MLIPSDPSVRTLLPLLVPLAPATTLLERFPESLRAMLEILGVNPTFIAAVRWAMNEGSYAKAASRQVLGVMNRFEFVRERYDENLLKLSPWQSDLLAGPLSGWLENSARGTVDAGRTELNMSQRCGRMKYSDAQDHPGPPSLLVVSAATQQDGPHYRPHISATPRDETDMRQHNSLKTNDMRDETDPRQPLASFF